MKTTILSSYGSLTVDEEGLVTSREYDGNGPEPIKALGDVAKVNLPEYREWDKQLPEANQSDDEIDFAIIGFWDTKGKYHAPDFFMRSMIVSDLNQA